MAAERVHPMPGNGLVHVENMGAYDEEGDGPKEVRTPAESLDDATVVTSEFEYIPGFHRPVLDLDFPAQLIPSTTPGHYHLYLDRAMAWDDYVHLLTVLGEVGILEPGYVKASIARGHTCLRLPWVRKLSGQAAIDSMVKAGHGATTPAPLPVEVF